MDAVVTLLVFLTGFMLAVLIILVLEGRQLADKVKEFHEWWNQNCDVHDMLHRRIAAAEERLNKLEGKQDAVIHTKRDC